MKILINYFKRRPKDMAKNRFKIQQQLEGTRASLDMRTITISFSLYYKTTMMPLNIY